MIQCWSILTLYPTLSWSSYSSSSNIFFSIDTVVVSCCSCWEKISCCVSCGLCVSVDKVHLEPGQEHETRSTSVSGAFACVFLLVVKIIIIINIINSSITELVGPTCCATLSSAFGLGPSSATPSWMAMRFLICLLMRKLTANWSDPLLHSMLSCKYVWATVWRVFLSSVMLRGWRGVSNLIAVPSNSQGSRRL